MATYNEYLYIDYENVQDIDVSFFREAMKINIITGQDQKCVPVELVSRIQKFGESVGWIQVEGKGKNALDFFIVHYLTKDYEHNQDKNFIIYSKDTGFDPLIKHLKSQNIKVKRIETLHPKETVTKVKAAPPKAVQPNIENLDASVLKAIDFLMTYKANSRPKKRKTLTNAIASHMTYEKPEEIARIVQILIQKKLIMEENGNVKFNLPQPTKK